jgi:hypothetical protein
MFDWHVQAQRNGQPHGQRITCSSPQEAIEAGNQILQTAEPNDEVLVCHRLYSNQAGLSFSKVIPASEIQLKANHLEQQARRASHSG